MQGDISRGAMRKIAEGVPLGTLSERLSQFYHQGTGRAADMSKIGDVMRGAVKGLEYTARRWNVEGLYNRYADMIDDTATGRTRFAWLLDKMMHQAHQQGTLSVLVIGREAVQVSDSRNGVKDETEEDMPKAVPTEE